jgi:hypothetical protein
MAKGRGGRAPSRMDKRREAEAAEAREKDDEREEEEEAEEESDEGDDDGDGKKKKPAKKKAAKKPAAPKKPSAKRTRTPKEVRRRAMWVVFDNSNKAVGKFAFNERKEAEAALAKKQEEKKGTFFLNLIKEEITD